MKILVRIVIVVASVFGAIFLVFVVLSLVPFKIAEAQTQSSFRLYPNAEHVIDSLARYGGQSNIKRVYYLSDDSLTAVQRYFEEFMPVFQIGDQAGDRQGQWFISGYNVDDTELSPYRENAKYQIHESLCHYQQRYGCVTVALVDLSQKQSLGTPATISWPVTYERDELVRKLNALPREGVLIVYAYYVNDF